MRESLAGSWRRLYRHLDAARTADGDDLRDAVVDCLHNLYDLWDVWVNARNHAFVQQQSGTPGKVRQFKIREQDDAVEGDPDGETAASLVFVRGGRTHGAVEPGELFTFGDSGFGLGPYGGGWAWHAYSNPKGDFARRDAWYRSHVEGRLIVEPLDAAVRWLKAQPELTS